MDSSSHIIRFLGVSKRLQNKQILKNISFDVYPGEIFGIIGSSGAGKTTLLRTAIGFYKIDQGDIRYDNRSITNDIRMIRSVFGFASQDNCFYDELTCMENLSYFGKLHRVPRKILKQRSYELLKLVELYSSKDEIAKNLSGGMRRRLDLACSLIHNPKILIMDEPTTGLDPLLRKHMWHLIKSINDRGTSIIVSSHLLEDIEHMCNRLGILYEGRLLVVGTPDQLKDLYSKNEEIHLETYPGRYDYIIQTLLSLRLPITFYVNKGHKLIIYTTRAENLLHNILHLLEQINEKLLDVDVNKPSLNEVFEAFTRYYKNVK